MRLLIFTFLAFGLLQQVNAQEKFKISGTVTDESGEPLIGTTVYLLETYRGASTNFNGTFEIADVPAGNYTLIASLIGYRADTAQLQVANTNMELTIRLIEQSVSLRSVEIVAERITERTAISNISFGSKALQTSQGLTEDPVRTLSALPGIGRAGDLFSPSQIYVRGGAPEENLFLMDNNKIHFPYYFGGQKSIFNTDALESVELLTGGFSAAYGNHMSSVMNVQTRDGDFEQYRGNVSIGFYNSAALVEGPIVKERLSGLVALRRTYLDLFLDETAGFPVPSLGDVTYKFTYKLNDRNKLSLSGLSSDESISFFSGAGQAGLPSILDTRGTNHFQSLQLKSSIKSKFYNKLSLTNAINHNTSEIGANLRLNIDAWQGGLRDDFTYFVSNRHKLKTGIEWQYSSFDNTGVAPLDPQQTDVDDPTTVLRPIDIHAQGEVIRSAYVLYDGNPWQPVGINAGIRLDQNPDHGYTDISPRFAVNYQVTDKSKVRFSTGIYSQFPGNESGTDLTSARAIHYIAGYEYRFSSTLYGWIEAYHKDYQNLVYYDELLNYSNTGYGTARGIDLFLRKEKGALRGWVSYSLSHSERLAPLLDEVSDFEFDQRHILNLVAEYHLPGPVTHWFIPSLFQANFRYADGTPYTPVVAASNDSGSWMAIKGEPFSLRNSDYQNLNFRVEWSFRMGKKVRGTSFTEVWNLLNHKNVLGRTYEYGEEYQDNVKEQPYYATTFLFGGGFKVEFGVDWP